MIKELSIAIIAAATGFTPNSERSARALDQMVQDYATCNVFWGIAADRAGTQNTSLSTRALGRQVNAAYEGARLEEFTKLPPGTFTKRIAAAEQELKKTLDKSGWNTLHSIYDSFCSDLYDNPGDSFIKRLPPVNLQQVPLPERKRV